MKFAGKHILMGVTGSIAAYKAAVLVRGLVKEGADVKVVMTPLAKQFITPLTMATLSKHPVLVDFFNPENGEWNSHVSLGEWADLYLIAPATANTMGKMAHGIADNLLLTVRWLWLLPWTLTCMRILQPGKTWRSCVRLVCISWNPGPENWPAACAARGEWRNRRR